MTSGTEDSAQPVGDSRPRAGDNRHGVVGFDEVSTSEPPSGSASVPASATEVFGGGLPQALRFADLLLGPGIVRGVIGPSERDRIWERHLLNSAVVQELLPADARVVDVGSGAGLPGIALACARADLRVDLVDPLQRRTIFLDEIVQELALSNRVRVVNGRAEDPQVRDVVGEAEWVTARAVAPLDRLSRVCLPLLRAGGSLLALKGQRAATEIAEHRRSIQKAGGEVVDVVSCGLGVLETPTLVVLVTKR